MTFENVMKTATESMFSTMQMYGLSQSIGQGYTIKDEVVHVQIDMLGDIKGLIILEMPGKEAILIANTMMMGMMTVDSVDDMCKSTVGELCNQISGGICTALSNLGVIADIRPPYIDIRKEALNPQRAVSFIGGTPDDVVNLFIVYTK